MKTKTRPTKKATPEPLFRLRRHESEALEKIGRPSGKHLREVLHDAIATGAKAVEDRWEERLLAAEPRAKILDAFSRRVLAKIALSEFEAELVARALRGAAMLAGGMGGLGVSPELIRNDLEDTIRIGPIRDEDQRDALLERVREWGVGELVAVLAAVDSYWKLAGEKPGREQRKALVASGLVSANLTGGDAR